MKAMLTEERQIFIDTKIQGRKMNKTLIATAFLIRYVDIHEWCIVAVDYCLRHVIKHFCFKQSYVEKQAKIKIKVQTTIYRTFL